MDTIRTPAVAGQFYPADAGSLQQQVDLYLEQAELKLKVRPRALVVPHAGYIYSGAVAASAYRCLQPFADTYRRVILLGPSHRHAFYGLALTNATRYQTPLGDIDIDPALTQLALQFPHVSIVPEAHKLEHSLEVQLPFLQRVLNDFTLLPVVVGDASYSEVHSFLEHCWLDDETLLLISSDLSHYLPYLQACDRDSKTSDAIIALDPEGIPEQGACGVRPLGGLLKMAQEKGWQASALDIRNSGDTAGNKDKVVGYGSYIFYSPKELSN